MAPVKGKKIKAAAKNQAVAKRTRPRNPKQPIDNVNVHIDEEPWTNASSRFQDTGRDENIAPAAPSISMNQDDGVGGQGDLPIQNMTDMAELEKTLAATRGKALVELCIMNIHT